MQKTRWAVIRTSGDADHREGVLLAPQGKAFSIGDLLTLPSGERSRWLVVDVRDDPAHADGGIVTVDAC